MAGKKLSELSSGSLSNLPLSGVTAVVYSGSTFQHTLSHLRSILVDSGSHVFTGSQVINGDLTVNGSLIANEYILSSSITNIEVQDVSGSSVFGNDMLDTHQFTGSILVTGSVNASYFVGDGSQLTNLPTQTTDVSMFLSSSTFNSLTSSFDSFTGSINNRVDGLEAATSSYITSIPVPTYISSGPTSPGGSVVANVNTIGINFSEANDFTFNRNGTLTFPDFTIQSTAFNVSSSATTGSNTFVGNQTITGSVDISGSATLNNDNIVSSNTIEKIETITSASYALITPVSGTLYIIID